MLMQLENVTKVFSRGETAHCVLDGVDFSIDAGEQCAIIGPSGSGKSTLLNLLAGLDAPTSGVVRFEGVDLASQSCDAMAEHRRTRVGMVFQQHHLQPHLTVFENVLLPTLPLSRDRRRSAGSRAMMLLERVALADRAGDRPWRLSGGQRQRVAAARAMINSPRLLLADEPTGSLDRETGEAAASLLVELCAAEGTAMVVVTHARWLASRMSRCEVLGGGVLRRAQTAELST